MRRPFTAIALISLARLMCGAGVAYAGDPTTADCLTASDTSLSASSHHKLRAARSALLTCSAESCPVDIRKECNRRIEEINVQVPTVIFQVKDAAGNDLSAVKVTMDDEVIAQRLEGTAISLDPGEHTFLFETAGVPSITRKFLIQQSQKERREIISFGGAGVGGPPPPPPLVDSHPLGAQKIAAIAAGGVGVVGLALGAVFGGMAMSQKSAAQTACPNGCPTQDASDKWSAAFTSGTVSTVGFIVGGVGVAGAAGLWFTAPSSVNTQVGFGPGMLQLKGTF